jgi:hypothetical protein
VSYARIATREAVAHTFQAKRPKYPPFSWHLLDEALAIRTMPYTLFYHMAYWSATAPYIAFWKLEKYAQIWYNMYSRNIDNALA